MKYVGSIGLALALSLTGLIAACGPATPDPNTPPAGGTAEPTNTAAPVTTAAPTAEPTSAPTSAPTAAPVAAPAGPPIMASKLGDELKKAGFDLAKLPASIEKMSDGQKKKIMPILVKAVGYEDCKGCHVENDYKKKTRNTKIAAHMWDDFVAKMKDEKGAGTIFCDSCHQGKPKILNRSDLKAVGKYMDDEYVKKMSRADKKSQECGSCHGDTMEMKIFDKMWMVNK